MTDPAPPSAAKIRALEGMRGLCALVVALSHLSANPYSATLAAAHPWYGVFVRGFIGIGFPAVWVFFVLSGYVMGHRYRQPFDGPALREYLYRRWLRIWPLMALAIGCAVAVEPGASAGVVLGNLVFLQGFAVPALPSDPPLWSLSYEVFYYILFGCIMRGWLPVRSLWIIGLIGVILSWFGSWQGYEALACVLFWAAGYWLARHADTSPWLRASAGGNGSLRALSHFTLATAYQIGSLLPSSMGLLGAHRVMALSHLVIAPLYLSIIAELLGFRVKRTRWLWALIVLSCLARVFLHRHETEPLERARVVMTLVHLLLALVLYLSSHRRWATFTLARWSFLGGLSYALYVLHWPTLTATWLFVQWTPAPALQFLVLGLGVGSTLVLAWLAERYYQAGFRWVIERVRR